MIIPQTQSQRTTENVPDCETPRWDTNRRDREMGHERLYNDYSFDNPVYNSNQLRQRFRMQRPLFCRIINKVVEGDVYFQQRRNAVGKLGLSPMKKCTAAIKNVSLWLGMIGSIDCMHWEWKNCPMAWKAQYAGQNKKTTLILEAVADQDLWIWHAFFGIPGSCNNLNVLYRSPVFDDVLHGRASPINFTVNGHEYNMAYYLANDIYPKWATFIQGITHPQIQKDKLFADHQAAARKDVERAFGVLQARFSIL
ncbi:uncharacterized protein LOC110715987 [Chenopodium quinoa]|uniref:uncharacterized protein LOC110715987 n=1 Tax=Chenopodium quinoa TaxID=63459 RepID=UPI000B775AF0|nr:uncharacterized protein LOC110715987 [Chenopodium quinoa]